MVSIAVKFRGFVVKERYYNEDTTWGVYVIKTSEALEHSNPVTPKDADWDSQFNEEGEQQYYVVIAGKMQHLSLGVEYEITAESDYVKKYNSWQYTPSLILSLAPKTFEESKLFLRGILNDKQATLLLRIYPDIVNQIMQGTDRVDLDTLYGIGEKTYAKIKDKVINNFIIADVIALLQPAGISYDSIVALLRHEENPQILKRKILENPYYLTRMKGYGFKRVDDIALKIKPELRVSDNRIIAFLKYFLFGKAENDGDTWVPIDELDSEVSNAIPECFDLYKEFVERETTNGSTFICLEDSKVGLCRYKRIEDDIVDILKGLNEVPFNTKITEQDIENGIKQTEKELGFELSEDQVSAVKGAFGKNVSLITGYSGSGKTSSSRAILNIYKIKSCSIITASFSAKAARRITEATGFKSKTIHKLLGAKPDGTFLHDASLPLAEDVIFIDEASMLNVDLLHSLLKAVKLGSRIIFVGDKAQLPPIGAGAPFADLMDMTNLFSTFTLTTVHRQAAKSGILTDANEIRKGHFPIAEPSAHLTTGELQDMTYCFRENHDNMQAIAIKRYLKAMDEDGVDNVVLIVPRKAKCPNSTEEINRIIQEQIFPRTQKQIKYGNKVFMLGAKVIQTVNDYEKGVVNGEIGYITDVLPQVPKEVPCVVVKYIGEDGKAKFVEYTRTHLNEISLAYCLTCHRFQGSQAQSVVVVVDSSHYKLLSRSWLYTALTRAQKRCLLIAEPNAFARCIKTDASRRRTWMSLERKNA